MLTRPFYNLLYTHTGSHQTSWISFQTFMAFPAREALPVTPKSIPIRFISNSFSRLSSFPAYRDVNPITAEWYHILSVSNVEICGLGSNGLKCNSHCNNLQSIHDYLNREIYRCPYKHLLVKLCDVFLYHWARNLDINTWVKILFCQQKWYYFIQHMSCSTR